MRCYVCGSLEIVTERPVPLCWWHNNPPLQGRDIFDDEVMDGELDDRGDFFPPHLDDLDIPVYPV